MVELPSVVITGASSGIGAVYANRFAHRGHDLLLVARDEERMNVLSAQLRRESGVVVEVLRADLTEAKALAAVEERLRHDDRVGVLINNAGASAPGEFVEQGGDRATDLIALNVTAPTRLSSAVAGRLVGRGSGAIVMIGSAVSLTPEYGQAVYGATKAFVLFLARALHQELNPRGVYVQAVLPAATRTEIWARSGRDVNTVPGVMDVDEFVDAALVGFDRRETVTLPSLHDLDLWTNFEQARLAIVSTVIQDHAAARYRTV